MNLMSYEPWETADAFTRHIDRLLRGQNRTAESQWVPAADISEQESRYVLKLDVPGVNPSDIDISVENSILTLSGSRASEQTGESNGFRRIERVSGKFERRFTLPDQVDSGAISARSNHGVLEIVIPKTAQAQPRRVEIAVN